MYKVRRLFVSLILFSYSLGMGITFKNSDKICADDPPFKEGYSITTSRGAISSKLRFFAALDEKNFEIEVRYLTDKSIKFKIKMSSTNSCGKTRIVFGGNDRYLGILSCDGWAVWDVYEEKKIFEEPEWTGYENVLSKNNTAILLRKKPQSNNSEFCEVVENESDMMPVAALPDADHCESPQEDISEDYDANIYEIIVFDFAEQKKIAQYNVLSLFVTGDFFIFGLKDNLFIIYDSVKQKEVFSIPDCLYMSTDDSFQGCFLAHKLAHKNDTPVVLGDFTVPGKLTFFKNIKNVSFGSFSEDRGKRYVSIKDGNDIILKNLVLEEKTKFEDVKRSFFDIYSGNYFVVIKNDGRSLFFKSLREGYRDFEYKCPFAFEDINFSFCGNYILFLMSNDSVQVYEINWAKLDRNNGNMFQKLYLQAWVKKNELEKEVKKNEQKFLTLYGHLRARNTRTIPRLLSLCAIGEKLGSDRAIVLDESNDIHMQKIVNIKKQIDALKDEVVKVEVVLAKLSMLNQKRKELLVKDEKANDILIYRDTSFLIPSVLAILKRGSRQRLFSSYEFPWNSFLFEFDVSYKPKFLNLKYGKFLLLQKKVESLEDVEQELYDCILFDLENKKELCRYEAFKRLRLDEHHKGNILFSLDDDLKELWSLKERRKIFSIDKCKVLKVSPCGKQLISLLEGQTMKYFKKSFSSMKKNAYTCKKFRDCLVVCDEK